MILIVADAIYYRFVNLMDEADPREWMIYYISQANNDSVNLRMINPFIVNPHIIHLSVYIFMASIVSSFSSSYTLFGSVHSRFTVFFGVP